jgi:hypothetical protein
MALWTSSYPLEAGDRDPSFTWVDADGGAPLDDGHNDIFNQFLDFEAGDSRIPGSATDADPFLMGQQHQQHQQHAEGSTSSGVSTADDYDFLSNGSNIAATMSAPSYEIDPHQLNLFTDGNNQVDEQNGAGAVNNQHNHAISDTELERLESISLHSPKKGSNASNPASSAHPRTAGTAGNSRKSKKFVDALSSTIRKATNRNRGRKASSSQVQQRAVSPSLENPPMALKPTRPNARRVHTQHTPGHLPESPPLQCDTNVANHFVNGFCEDPFNGDGISPTQPTPARYYSQGGLGTPLDSPTHATMSEPNSAVPHWHHPHNLQHQHQQQQQQQHQQQQQWTQQENWWAQQHNGQIDHKNIDANMAMHSQHGELPYEYSQVSDTSNGGLMIHMPQPQQGTSQTGTNVHDLALNAQTYLPPPPPPPPPIPQNDRAPQRPPRAPSSGARHHHRNMSSSPMRKTRAPSASPSPGTKQSRQSSGSSGRSASGRLPGSMPGTPCSVRKRRSRDTGCSMSAVSDDADSGGGSGGITLGGGGGIGFVNFTPNDGSMLMTGVAPSGSSKTKARREKEAQDRRRRLSEAAMKAVAAAGGDIEKLRQQGFDV